MVVVMAQYPTFGRHFCPFEWACVAKSFKDKENHKMILKLSDLLQ
jgi:hypothetical protein